jgi:phosphate transport system substrate-binding protein
MSMPSLPLPRRSRGAVLAAAGLLSLACGRAGTEIVVQGSPTLLPVARPAVAAYRPTRRPTAVLLTAGNAEGVRALLAGTCDIAALARQLTPAESRGALEAGADLRTFRLGYAGAVPVVHRDNPVTALTVEQLRGIWSGTTRNWKEVGGPDLPIHVVTRAAGSALSDLWDESVMQGASTRADATLAATAEGEADPLLAVVGHDPAAIGFTAMGAIAGLKPLAVGGIAATAESLKSGRFPLSRTLYLVTDGRTATDTVQGFVDFLLEPEGQTLVRRAGYLPA